MSASSLEVFVLVGKALFTTRLTLATKPQLVLSTVCNCDFVVLVDTARAENCQCCFSFYCPYLEFRIRICTHVIDILGSALNFSRVNIRACFRDPCNVCHVKRSICRFLAEIHCKKLVCPNRFICEYPQSAS